MYNNNITINKNFYDSLYEKEFNIRKFEILNNNFYTEFNRLKKTHASINLLYSQDFEKSLKGSKVLEFGAGDCYNAFIMAKLGADVFVNDISTTTQKIVETLNSNFGTKIEYIGSDILNLKNTNHNRFFDFIIGMDVIHHLDNELEYLIMERLVDFIKPFNGRIVLVEPMQNSLIINKLRLLFPGDSRPSILNYKEYNRNKAFDPHPVRDNSKRNYQRVGKNLKLNMTVLYWGYAVYLMKFFPKNKISLVKIDNILARSKMFNFFFGYFAQRLRCEYFIY
jgi:2-polyprenyl-3-methyl-5-hydroxy-6-metoxy-1,4-benzoquinol methylase